MKYKVELQGSSHYVMGLVSEGFGTEDFPDQPNTMLVYHYRAGDVDTHMREPHMMLGALYDLFQMEEALKDGDTFETEFGEYACQGVHVVPLFEMPPEPERLKRQHNTHW